ncbi:hypothetical protein [Gymnodinialimonas sp.]
MSTPSPQAQAIARYLDDFDGITEASELSRYHRLVQIDPNLKGQLSTAIGAIGGRLKLSVDGSWFGAVPGLGWLSALVAPKISNTADRNSVYMIGIYRMPKSIWTSTLLRPATGAAKGRKKAHRAGQPAPTAMTWWQTQSPTALLLLTGACFEGQAKVSKTAKMEQAFQPLSILELKGTLTFKASAEVHLKDTKLYDPQPQYFGGNGQSEAMARAMRTAVDISVVDKARNLIAAAAKLSVVAPANGPATPAGIRDAIGQFRSGLTTMLGRFGWVVEAAEAKAVATAKDEVKTRTGVEIKGGTLPSQLLDTAPDLDKLIADLDHIRIVTTGLSKKGNPRNAKRKRARELMVARHAQDLITELQHLRVERGFEATGYLQRFADWMGLSLHPAGKPAPAPKPLTPGPYTMLLARSWGGTFDAGAKGAGAVDLTLVNTGVTLGGEASASASVGTSGRSRWTDYRFQVASEASGGRQIVMTQDVRQAKQQLDIGRATDQSAAHKAYLNALHVEEDDEDEGAAVPTGPGTAYYNTLAYSAVTVFWPYKSEGSPARALPNGSGVSFGLTLNADLFLKWLEKARSGGALEAAERAVQTQILASLRLTKANLKSFAKECPIDAGYRASMTEAGIETISLEAGFAFATQLQIPLEAHTPAIAEVARPGTSYAPRALFDLDKVKALDTKGKGLILNTIRVRVPLGGTKSENETVFDLGLTDTYGFGLAYEATLGVSVESTLDLHVWTAPTDGPTLAPDRLAELSVPPVAMVHH